MSWSEKSKEIAVSLLEKMENGADGSYTRQEVLEMLLYAAYMGMQHECDCWVTKTR